LPRGGAYIEINVCATLGNRRGCKELVDRAGPRLGRPNPTINQKTTLADSQSHRSPPLPANWLDWLNVEVITPKDVLPLVQVVPGLAKCGVFVRLKHSARICNLKRSVSRKSRKRLASKLKKPGPRMISRPVLPKATVPVATPVKAEGSK